MFQVERISPADTEIYLERAASERDTRAAGRRRPTNKRGIKQLVMRAGRQKRKCGPRRQEGAAGAACRSAAAEGLQAAVGM